MTRVFRIPFEFRILNSEIRILNVYTWLYWFISVLQTFEWNQLSQASNRLWFKEGMVDIFLYFLYSSVCLRYVRPSQVRCEKRRVWSNCGKQWRRLIWAIPVPKLANYIKRCPKLCIVREHASPHARTHALSLSLSLSFFSNIKPLVTYLFHL